MKHSASRSSLCKKSLNDKYLTDHNKLLLTKIQATLLKAGMSLPYVQFHQFYQDVIRSLIVKYQAESVQAENINFLKKITTKYNPSTQLTVRLLLLQVKSNLHIFPEESLATLTKVKHIIIDTQNQYILSKVFILEAQIYQALNRKDLQSKSLQKSIEFAQNFVLEYLNDQQAHRKQITQNIIVAYFQLFKLKKQDNHNEAEQFIKKACRTTQKNYGHQSEITELLNLVYNDHKNIGKGLQKINFSLKGSQKAITEIMKNEIKKNFIIYGFYSWEDQKIVVQMIKGKNDDTKTISEAQYFVKLDIGKISDLRNSDWYRISQGEVSILEQEVMKVIGVKPEYTVTTRIGIKTISREDIIKKDDLSSSSEDPSFIEKEDFNFIRKLGRAQSAKRQVNS